MTIHLGERLPPLTLPDLSGKPISLARYRGAPSLALLLAGDGSDPDWLPAVAALEPELRAWGAETALTVAAPPPEVASLRRRLGFRGVTLLDAGGALHQRLGAADATGRPRPALLLADRAGELRHRLDPPAASPEELAEVIAWARYLGIQEPECGTCVPAWSPEQME